MLCDRCHIRQAKLVITQLIGQKQIKLYLCEQCANETEGYIINNSSLQKLLSSAIDLNLNNTNQSTLHCEKCGMTLEELKKTSKIGCANCYNVFGDYLLPIFRRMHSNVNHTGKRPKRLEGEIMVAQTIEKLQKELQISIMKEEYEEAARLRDEIRGLKKEVGPNEMV
jgi:protein arginine kinase activator